MAIFFLLVSLEIKRKLMEGELSSPDKTVLSIGVALRDRPDNPIHVFYISEPTWGKAGGIPKATGIASPLESLEHLIANPVNFIIMPQFALAKTSYPHP